MKVDVLNESFLDAFAFGERKDTLHIHLRGRQRKVDLFGIGVLVVRGTQVKIHRRIGRKGLGVGDRRGEVIVLGKG